MVARGRDWWEGGVDEMPEDSQRYKLSNYEKVLRIVTNTVFESC